MDFENFDPNLMEAIEQGYQEDLKRGVNVIGASSIPFGIRSNIISKKHNLSIEWSNKLLSGKIFHRGLQKKAVMNHITKEINEALGYNEREIEFHLMDGLLSFKKRYLELANNKFIEFEVKKEVAKLIKFKPERYFRMHSDIWTTLYTIEIKTTNMPKSMWKELAAYQLMQLNTYLGFNHHSFGFLLKVDLGSMKEGESHGGIFNSSSKRFSFLWNKYFMLYPHNFNKELFNYTLGRIELFFNYMENNTEMGEIPCPEFIFRCSNSCREYCPNPIDKVKTDFSETCEHCKEEILANTTYIIRNDQTYHYTTEKGHIHEVCVNACKRAWRCKE